MMTRDEAIATLEEMIKLGDLYEVDIDACKIAIETLKQEPCGDAISRQEALKLFATNDGKYLYEAIRDLPSVTPQEPKTGRWIMSDDGLYRPICNNCGAHPWKGYIPTVEEATKVFKYCPHCGARMESEEQE